MKHIQHLSNLLNGFKTLGLVIVIALSAVAYVTSQTDRTAAFLSTRLEDIKMGVGAGDWLPPEAPVVLGYQYLDADQNQRLVSCDSSTQQSQLTLAWSESEVDKGSVTTYFVGTEAEPYLYELDGQATSLELELEEGSQSFQVIAVDNKDNQSPPSDICSVTVDTTPPVLSVIQPTVDTVGTDVKFEIGVEEESSLTGLELNLSEAELGDVLTVQLDDSYLNAAGNFEYQLDTTQQSTGSYLATFIATDVAGNIASSEKILSLDLDAPTSTLSMEVPVSSNSGLISNGSFESGLDGWQVEGQLSLSGLSQTQKQPQQGNLAAVLGDQDKQSQVTVLSQDLASVTEQIDSIGFWYYLNPVSNLSELEDGMMVFIDDELVYEDWFTPDQSTGWKYVSVDTSLVTDASISVAYYQDDSSSTKGQLYIDGFTTNQELSLSDISLTVEASDRLSNATVVVEYATDGEVTRLEESALLNLQLDQAPDNQLLSYWSYDAVGNVEKVTTFYLPLLTDVLVGGPVEASPTPTILPSPSSSPSPEATESGQIESTVQVEDRTNNSFALILENFSQPAEGEYTVLYSQGGDQLIQEAIQGTYQVEENQEQVVIDDLYFGTCSSTAGAVCTPHIHVQDILIEILHTDQEESTEYQFSFPGLWTSEELESGNEAS